MCSGAWQLGLNIEMQVLDCRVREMGLRLLGGAPRFFLVQLRGHSALHFLILYSMALWVRFWLWRMLMLFISQGCTKVVSVPLWVVPDLPAWEGYAQGNAEEFVSLASCEAVLPPTVLSLLLFISCCLWLLASALRAEQVEDLGGHVVRYTHLGNFAAFWMWSSLEWLNRKRGLSSLRWLLRDPWSSRAAFLWAVQMTTLLFFQVWLYGRFWRDDLGMEVTCIRWYFTFPILWILILWGVGEK